MLILLFNSTNKDYSRFHYVLFFFFTTFLSSALNIQRQALATCFFFLSVKYIDRNIYKYYLCVICASFIHYSSAILLPFWFISNKYLKPLDNQKLAVIAYLCTFIFATIFGEYINSILPMLLSSDKYLNNLDNIDEQMNISTGLGIIVKHILNIIIILFSTQMIRFYDNSCWLKNMYRCFLVGALFANVFGSSVFLSRVPFALCSLKIFLFAYMTYFLFHSRLNRLSHTLIGAFIIVMCLTMLFFAIAHGDGGISPYEFKWI